MICSPTLDEVLCEDADAVLYRAHTDEGRAVLVKAPKAEVPSSAECEALRREAEVARAAGADVAAAPEGMVMVDGRPTLLLRDDGGTTLARLLEAPLSLGRVLPIALALVEALETIHARQLVHGGLHPGDILVLLDGRVELLGFGMADGVRSPARTRRSASAWPYLSPEQTGRSSSRADQRSDLYAVGVILYQMLARRLPLEASDIFGWFHAHCAVVPQPLSTYAPDVPPTLGRIVDKLLAKTPECRYQTASGLRHDLERCSSSWTERGAVDDFVLGLADAPPPLRVSDHLHGRREEARLVQLALERVRSRSRVETVLVSGPAGIGKTRLVKEALHRAPVAEGRAVFAVGACEPARMTVPGGALLDALDGILRVTLESSAEPPDAIRRRLEEALDVNLPLLASLLPSLARVVDSLASPSDAPIPEPTSRFLLALDQYVGALSTDERPVVLVVDDLQWADSTTLEALDHWALDPASPPILLVGVYRSGDVPTDERIVEMIAHLRDSDSALTEIELEPLTLEAMSSWVAETFQIPHQDAEPLAAAVAGHTGNNPLFVERFFELLRTENRVRYDSEARRWLWDIDGLRAEPYTDDVAALIAENIGALSPQTQVALAVLAAYGSSADLTTLAIILDCSEQEALDRLGGAFRTRLIARDEGTVRFLHDRIQQIAYEQLAEQKADVHLRIGRALLRRLSPSAQEERIFDLVCQFELASPLVDDRDERIRIAELELLAGQKAQRSTRFASATHFLSRGIRLLAEDAWQSRHDLAFALHFALARSRLVVGELDSARRLGTTLLERSRTGGESAAVHGLLAELDLLQGSFDDAVAECLVGLEALGVALPAHPTEAAAGAAASKAIARIFAEGPATILDRPATTDADLTAICELISSLLAPAVMVDWNLVWLAASVGVERSLVQGNTRSSPIAYAALGVFLAKEGRYDEAFRLGEAAYALAKREESATHRPRTSFAFIALLSYLRLGIRSCVELLREELDVAKAIGDQSFACYLAKHAVQFRFFVGDPLADLEEAGLEAKRFADGAGYRLVRDQVDSLYCLIQRLRGVPGACFRLQEALDATEQPLPRFHFFLHELIACHVLGDHDGAVRAADQAEALAGSVRGFLEVPQLHFYAALARAEGAGAGDDLEATIAAVRRHHRFLQGLAAQVPANFGAREALVAAELHRLTGDALAAEHAYETAIRAARTATQIQVEAFANERAGRFHQGRGMHTAASAYFAQAHACYESWGAAPRAARLAEEFPGVTHRVPPTEELASIIKAQHAISSALHLPDLQARLIDIALEHARARRGCLLQVDAERPLVVAATGGHGAESFGAVGSPADPTRLPLALCRGAMRLKKAVSIADALVENRYSFDPYFESAHLRSVLCLPIVRAGRVIALLYLENDLVPGTFSADRLSVLDCIAAQAAISLENATLYAKLERENAERRRAQEEVAKKTQLLEAILDATPLLVFIKDPDGRYLLVNRKFGEVYHLDDRAEFLGKTDYDLFPRETAEELQRNDRLALDEGRPIERDEVIAQDDGVHSYLSIKFPLRDDDEEPWAVCGIATDVTCWRRADEELRRSLSLVEATLESTADGILVTALDGRIVRYNRRFLGMWRLPEDLARAGDDLKAVAAVSDQLVDPAAFVAKIKELYAEAEAECSDVLHLKDGRVFERFSLPHRIADRVVGRVWSFRDVTQRVHAAEERTRLLAEEQRARADAEEAVHVRDEFLSIASHELRTPLASLSLAVESLSTFLVEPIDAGRVRRSANIAKRQVQRIVALVDMLLDISRIRSGKLVLSPARIDLRSVVADVSALLATELARSGSELVVSAPEPLIGLWDPLRLEQVVTNLLTNAIKFGRGRPITVDLVRVGNDARLCVTDTGIGMPEERRTRIFEPFTRLVSSRHYGGLGLGLHITKTIVEAHGGSITVESKEGHGSSFVVSLPLASAT